MRLPSVFILLLSGAVYCAPLTQDSNTQSISSRSSSLRLFGRSPPASSSSSQDRRAQTPEPDGQQSQDSASTPTYSPERLLSSEDAKLLQAVWEEVEIQKRAYLSQFSEGISNGMISGIRNEAEEAARNAQKYRESTGKTIDMSDIRSALDKVQVMDRFVVQELVYRAGDYYDHERQHLFFDASTRAKKYMEWRQELDHMYDMQVRELEKHIQSVEERLRN